MDLKLFVIIVIANVLLTPIKATLEQGIHEITASNEENVIMITKSMYNQTQIAVTIECNNNADDMIQLEIEWFLWYSPCEEEFQNLDRRAIKEAFTTKPINNTSTIPNLYLQQASSDPIITDCNSVIFLHDESGNKVLTITTKPPSKPTPSEDGIPSGNVAPENSSGNVAHASETSRTNTRKKRAEDNDASVTTTRNNYDHNKEDHSVVTTTKIDGNHLFILELMQYFPIENNDASFTANVKISTKGPHGYLSATQWPLLPFYGTMCIVYLLFGFVWMILLACNWRDLLRIQFWIGGVIFIGMLEKAVFFGEYESVNTTGKSVTGALLFAEIVSSLKRAVARVLVIIVSLGFGIVKPRLGPMLHKVIGVGTLYFILASIESCVRTTKDGNQNKAALMSSIPLAVLDAALCWWIFTSLIQTTRTLRLRRNVVKLSLYRHFTNTLIFVVLASIAYMIWSIKQHKFAACLTDWRELWVDDAFWHILFCIILAVIMVLWRPSINNQRYAFSPLLDAAEEDDEYFDEDQPKNEALDAQKRSSKVKQVQPKDKNKSADDDLKWIDENIPASVADTALPSLLDSDEEVMTTKYEMSKME